MIRALATSLLLVSPLLAGAAERPQDPATPSWQAQNPPPTVPQAPTPSSTKPKPKKVWTNDNVADSGAISVVGPPRSTSKAQTKKSSAEEAVDPKVLRALREQLQRLQTSLAVVDQQLSDLKDFGKGDSKHAGGLSTNTWQYNSSSVDEQIKQLQSKRTNIQARIDELLDAARAAGIEPGQLR